MSFNKGDVVQLKSGGPTMTVTGILGQDACLDLARANGYEEGDVSVEYFDQAKLVKNMFKKTSIQKVEEISSN